MPHRNFDSRADLGLLALRLIAGSMLLFGHGLPKLLKWSEMAGSFPDPLGFGSPTTLALAIAAELGCSLLVLLGAYARVATVPVVATMFVAAFIFHAADPWQKKELAVLFGAAFLTVLVAGPGRYSVDAMLARGRR